MSTTQTPTITTVDELDDLIYRFTSPGHVTRGTVHYLYTGAGIPAMLRLEFTGFVSGARVYIDQFVEGVTDSVCQAVFTDTTPASAIMAFCANLTGR